MKYRKANYKQLLSNIGVAIDTARQNTIKTINASLVKVNWEIGRHIV